MIDGAGGTEFFIVEAQAGAVYRADLASLGT